MYGRKQPWGSNDPPYPKRGHHHTQVLLSTRTHIRTFSNDYVIRNFALHVCHERSPFMNRPPPPPTGYRWRFLHFVRNLIHYGDNTEIVRHYVPLATRVLKPVLFPSLAHYLIQIYQCCSLSRCFSKLAASNYVWSKYWHLI